ncbi:phosphopantetheine-binding protein [Flavobacterium sp. HSC-61S13]|uniref:phosphopantetheine-binding protein n=1 Tax=Flavobacterium sp. HSC-61S13 TaxID=2910963 RepID=UPI00209DAE29|nr:phosphopantetheine-binding protein [Flavobacterium sp. HSC-61S13]MCP1996350.1 acyl carrier protein [Flavobacterium sp. HSC-61S13]
MKNLDVLEKINAILVDEFEVDSTIIAPENNLKTTLQLDSLDYVDLVVIIESNFGVKLVEADFVNVATFSDFYALIESKLLLRN